MKNRDVLNSLDSELMEFLTMLDKHRPLELFPANSNRYPERSVKLTKNISQEYIRGFADRHGIKITMVSGDLHIYLTVNK